MESGGGSISGQRGYWTVEDIGQGGYWAGRRILDRGWRRILGDGIGDIPGHTNVKVKNSSNVPCVPLSFPSFAFRP